MPDTTLQPAPATEAACRPIVFFDGDCAFCNHATIALLQMDDDERLLFAPLQGNTARALLPQALRHEQALDTVALREPSGRVLIRSDAVMGILRHVGGPYAFIGIGRAIPRPWRDALYNWVARRRLRLVRNRPCPLPSSSDRRRFLP